jgi:hypothetical protein
MSQWGYPQSVANVVYRSHNEFLGVRECALGWFLRSQQIWKLSLGRGIIVIRHASQAYFICRILFLGQSYRLPIVTIFPLNIVL